MTDQVLSSKSSDGKFDPAIAVWFGQTSLHYGLRSGYWSAEPRCRIRK